MNIPTPGDLKKRADEKQQIDEKIESLEAKLHTPPAKPSKRSQRPSKSRGGSGRTDRSRQKPQKDDAKKHHERPEHLVSRPLLNDSGLQSLKARLEQEASA